MYKRQAVNALEALAAGLCLSDGLLCPLQDARAGQVYAAAFWGGLPPQRALPDQAVALDAFLDAALGVAGESHLVFTGDGVAPYRQVIAARLGGRARFAPAHLCYLRPASAAALAWTRRDETTDYLGLMPVYLRAPQAERERRQRQGENA